MRTDANHAGNKQYAPNSFAHKFRPDAAEAPYAVADSVVSRKSHFWHEGKRNDYDQARELWVRVMTNGQRENTAANTGKYLNQVQYPEVQVRRGNSITTALSHVADTTAVQVPCSAA
jgi:catalase